MKRLNLKIGRIGEMLTREQMKKVVGGDYGRGDCSSECTTDAGCTAEWPKCTSSICPDGSSTTFKVCTK